MRVVWSPQPALRQFEADVAPWLERSPLIHNQVLGVLRAAIAGRYDTCWTLVVHDDDAQPALVAVRTPPRALLLSQGVAEAVEALARDLHARQVALPAVIGPAEQAHAFAAAWCALHPGMRSRVERPLILYRCDALISPAPVPGQPRPSTEADAPLITEWGRAFERDAGLPPSSDVEARMHQLCAACDVWIWEVEGAPVACAAVVRRNADTASIGLVYTPRAQRRQGFGAAVTAALTRHLLDREVAYTNLFTDGANATTNHIYQTIGYTRVCDFVDIVFV